MTLPRVTLPYRPARIRSPAMDFTPTPEEEMVRKQVREFAEREKPYEC